MTCKDTIQEMDEYKQQLDQVLEKRGQIARELYDRVSQGMPSYGYIGSSATGVVKFGAIDLQERDQVNEIVKNSRGVRQFDSSINNLQRKIRELYLKLPCGRILDETW